MRLSRMYRMPYRVGGGATPPLTCDVTDVPDVPDDSDLLQGRAHAHTRGCIENIRYAGTSGTPSFGQTPPISGGRAVVNGREHLMRMAMPSSVTARLYGLNPNHHVRVWCTCRDRRRDAYVRRASPPARQRVDVEAVEAAGVIPRHLDDPRALGDFDWLGIADVRESGSALAVFRRHIEEVARHDGS